MSQTRKRMRYIQQLLVDGYWRTVVDGSQGKAFFVQPDLDHSKFVEFWSHKIRIFGIIVNQVSEILDFKLLDFKLFRVVFRVWFLMRNELILQCSDWLAGFWSSFKRVFWRQTCSPSAVIEERERLCQRKRRLHHIDSCFTTMDQN